MSTGETNGEVQDKLKRLINASGLGIEADIVHDDSGKAALQLTSMQTGLSETEDSLFSVAPSANAESISMMKQLGIDKVSSLPTTLTFAEWHRALILVQHLYHQ